MFFNHDKATLHLNVLLQARRLVGAVMKIRRLQDEERQAAWTRALGVGWSFFPRAPQSPYWAPVTVRQRRAKANRDPSCTRWVRRRPSEHEAENRELAERSARSRCQKASKDVGSQ